MAQFSSGDEAVVVTVENLFRNKQLDIDLRERSVSNLEGFSDLFLGVGVLHLAGHHGQELCDENVSLVLGVVQHCAG